MNNNNHFNTNNWIGTTHLDFFKNSSNALSNYTYNTSNILENDILINSNINYLYTSNSSNSNIIYTSNVSNIILDRYDKLIKEEEEEILLPLPTTLKHTYIYNKNQGGEIRFQNQAYITDILGFPAGTPNYKVKIDIDGKLKLYWVYNPLVSLIYLGGWHEPISEIAGLTADSINQGGLITALQGEVVIIKKYTDSELSLIWAYIEGIQQGIITPGQTTITPAENARDMLNWGSPEIPATPSTPLIPASPIQNANALSTFQERVQGLANIREVIRNSTLIRITDQVTSYITQNPITSFFLGTGFTSLGIAYGILQGIEYNRYYNGVIENVIQNNSNLSAGVRLSLHNLNQSNIIASNLIDYCSNTYYLGISQGFLNSNTITQQYLNSINTNQLSLSQTNISNIFVNSNLIYDKSYTDNRKYPPKLFTSSSSQSSITYLGQTPIYYETINLNTIDISYGSGTYEIYSSENNTTSISITGTGNNVFNVANDDNYSYAFFASNGTFTTNSNIICDILVVGGGASGNQRHSGGGGAGALIYSTNITLSSGTYTINIGDGGIAPPYANPGVIINGNNGGDSEILLGSTVLFRAKGGGYGSGNNTNTSGGNGGSGGGCTGNNRAEQTVGVAVNTNIINGVSGFTRGNSGGKGDGGGGNAEEWSGGGGGGAGSAGSNSTLDQGVNTNGGNGGNGLEINITGTPTYYAGGGGGGISNTTNGTAGSGGLGGGGAGSKGSLTATSGTANTGGGGGGGGFNTSTGNGLGGNGGTGVVIIRYLKTANQTKKELFNFITNEVGSEYGSFNYNSTTGDYLSTDRYIKNDYYGDFLVVKLPSQIIINRFRIYSRPSFVERAPSLLRLYGSIDNINWEEIPEGSITTALVVGNYSLGYYEKVVNNQIKSYSYFGIVVNKIIGGNSNANNLNFTEFEIYGKEFVSFVPIYTTSNVLSNTSNTIFNNYSNLNLTTSNNLFNYSSNNSNFFSNQILITSNNLANYTSNNSNFFSNLNYNSLYSSNSNIYTTSNAVKYIVHNEMPRVNKKSAFFCSTTNLIYPNGSTPYYAYHLYLPDYTATGYIQIGSGSGDTYRIFKIKVFFASMYFQKLVNGMPDIVDYTIYMSNKANAGGDGTIAGINIMARGEPANPFLDNLIRNNIFLLRNNTSSSSFNFNYLSILTPQTSDLRVFIEDLLN